MEALCIEIIKPKSRPFALLACYCPPYSNSDEVLRQLENIIEILDMEEKELYIMGDLNYNFLVQDNTRCPLETVYEVYQLMQIIDEATRITHSSRSLIDIILTNAPNRIKKSGVLHLGISDHSVVYAIRKIAIPTKSKHKVITARNYKHFSAVKFKSDLRGIDWKKLKHLSDPNEVWNKWKTQFLSIADSHAPMKTKRQRKRKSPWMNSTIKQHMNERDKLKSRAVKSGDVEYWKKFKNSKNRVNNEIKNVKNTYYQQHFKDNAGNSQARMENYQRSNGAKYQK